MRVIKALTKEFVRSFKEGLVLFFSPFIGLWRAIGDLHLGSKVRELFASQKKSMPQH